MNKKDMFKKLNENRGNVAGFRMMYEVLNFGFEEEDIVFLIREETTFSGGFKFEVGIDELYGRTGISYEDFLDEEEEWE